MAFKAADVTPGKDRARRTSVLKNVTISAYAPRIMSVLPWCRVHIYRRLNKFELLGHDPD